MSDFSERLREERARLGLTQEAFGELGGVRKQAQSLYESGKRTPDAAYLAGLHRAGVDVTYLLVGTRAMSDGYPVTHLTTVINTGDGADAVFQLESPDGLAWRDVLIIAVDEPLDATQCGGKGNCHGSDHKNGLHCMTHDLWSNLNSKMVDYLDSVSLQDLVDQQRQKSQEHAMLVVRTKSDNHVTN